MSKEDPTYISLDFSDKRRIEDLTPLEIECLNLNLDFLIEDKFPTILRAVVGSWCFNVDKPNDMDIYLQVPRSFRVIEFPSDTGKGYDLINWIAKRQIHTKFNKTLKLERAQVILSNKLPNSTPFEEFPYFDLEKQKWVGKKEGESFGKGFIWVGDKKKKIKIIDRA